MDKLKRLLKKTPPVPLGIAGALLFLLLFYTLAFRTPLWQVWMPPNIDNDEVIYNRQVVSVITHGGLLGFLYSWAGVALGGCSMFLLWRRVVKRFFWKFASRSPKLEKAQQWVNRFDTSSLFMLTLLPFTPSSFMHLAFGISDFDEKRYLITMLLGKGVMVALIALFGQSLVSSMKNPVYLVLAILLWAGMYWVSKKFCKKHNLE